MSADGQTEFEREKRTVGEGERETRRGNLIESGKEEEREGKPEGTPMRSPFLLPSLSPGAQTHTHTKKRRLPLFPLPKKGAGAGGPM